MNNYKILTTLVIFIFIFSLGAYGDKIILKNGDSISGQIEFPENMVSVKPDYSEKILVEKEKIKNSAGISLAN